MLDYCYTCPNQDGEPQRPIRACPPPSHVGWSPSRGWPKAIRAEGRRATSHPIASSRPASGARDPASHLIVEAEDGCTLSRGIQGLAIRMAKAVNRVLGRRGRVWGDRYHVRALSTPREVRNVLVYVLQNWRKHMPGIRGFDPCSSAVWFRGWKKMPSTTPAASPVVAARTWLAAVGWRRLGLIGDDEAPLRPRPPKTT